MPLLFLCSLWLARHFRFDKSSLKIFMIIPVVSSLLSTCYFPALCFHSLFLSYVTVPHKCALFYRVLLAWFLFCLFIIIFCFFYSFCFPFIYFHVSVLLQCAELQSRSEATMHSKEGVKFRRGRTQP